MFRNLLSLLQIGDGLAIAALTAFVVAVAAFIGFGTRLSVIDVRSHLLPNRLVFPWGITALVTLLSCSIMTGMSVNGQPLSYDPTTGSFTTYGWVDAASVMGIWGLRVVAGGVFGWLLFFTVGQIFPQGLGFGDVKLAAVLGLYLGFAGWWQMFLGLLFTFVLAGGVSTVLLLAKKITRDTRIPLGPYMILGTALAFVIPG